MRTRSAREIWETALGELQLQVSKANFRTWLEKTIGLNFLDSQFVVGVPNTFVAEYLDKNLRSLIEKTLIGLTQSNLRVTFSIDGKQPIESSPAGTTELAVTLAESSPRLNPGYTFESFVVSDCNRLAYAAAMGAAEKPGQRSYNPLYIYGGVGLGKTHLLHAIGHVGRANKLKVLFVSAEQFTNEFVNAIRERRMEDFRSRYRSADMLLIDDIQFISGKGQTEDSFFHIFNELHDHDHQIALTSNCPPRSIPHIEDKLRSRLEWGLTAGIHTPDYTTRLAILSAKAEQENAEIGQDVLELMAETVKQNIRELEGSLNRVIAYAKLLRTMITPEIAAKALEDIGGKQPARMASPNALLESVTGRFQVNAADIISPKRDKRTTLARQVTMYLFHEETGFSLSQIGRELGGREAITVSQACKKIAAAMETNTGLKQMVQDIQTQIHSGNK